VFEFNQVFVYLGNAPVDRLGVPWIAVDPVEQIEITQRALYRQAHAMQVRVCGFFGGRGGVEQRGEDAEQQGKQSTRHKNSMNAKACDGSQAWDGGGGRHAESRMPEHSGVAVEPGEHLARRHGEPLMLAQWLG